MKTKHITEIFIVVIIFWGYQSLGQATQNQPELIEKIRQELVNLSIIHLDSQEFRLPMTIAKAGYWDDALQMTKKIAPINTAYVLSHLSLISAGFSDINRTKQIIEDALSQTEFEEYGDLAIITLGNLAKAASRMNQPEQVSRLLNHIMQIIESSPDEIAMIYTLPEVYSDIANLLPGDWEKSLLINHLDKLSEIAQERKLHGYSKIDIALARIAVTFAEIGDIERSRKAASILSYGFHKTSTLAKIAIICIRSGHAEEGFEFFSMVEEYFATQREESHAEMAGERIMFLADMAVTFSEIGQTSQAIRMIEMAAQQIEAIPEYRIDVITKISNAFLKLHHAEEATQVIERVTQRIRNIDNLGYRAAILSNIALLCINIKNFEMGSQITEEALKLRDEDIQGKKEYAAENENPEVLMNAAKVYAKLERWKDVINLIQQLRNPNEYYFEEDTQYYKAEVLNFIVNAFPDIEHLQQVYEMMNYSAEKIDEERQSVLMTILSVWAQQQYSEFYEITPVKSIGELDLVRLL